MSDEYRGYKIPKPYGSGAYGWIINDGSFGYFTGSKESVVATWKRAVDGYALRQVLQYDGNFETPFDPEVYGCKLCGASVYDPEKRESWHNAGGTND